MKEFIAACVQIAITPNDVPANVAKGLEWLRKAVLQHEADLVVFPETVTTGYDTGLSAEELWDLVDEAPGRITASKVEDGNVTMTRPLCPHPQVAVYRGRGNPNEARNFECAVPE